MLCRAMQAVIRYLSRSRVCDKAGSLVCVKYFRERKKERNKGGREKKVERMEGPRSTYMYNN